MFCVVYFLSMGNFDSNIGSVSSTIASHSCVSRIRPTLLRCFVVFVRVVRYDSIF